MLEKKQLERLRPVGGPMPDVLVRSRTDEWSELLRYFNGVTHHNLVPSATDLVARVQELELFLLEHLEPRTFDDQDAIDQIIAEVEGSNDS